MKQPEELKHGDVIQVTDPVHNWFGTICIVQELRKDAIVVYGILPTNNKNKNLKSHTLVGFKQFWYIGMAKYFD